MGIRKNISHETTPTCLLPHLKPRRPALAPPARPSLSTLLPTTRLMLPRLPFRSAWPSSVELPREPSRWPEHLVRELDHTRLSRLRSPRSLRPRSPRRSRRQRSQLPRRLRSQRRPPRNLLPRSPPRRLPRSQLPRRLHPKRLPRRLHPRRSKPCNSLQYFVPDKFKISRCKDSDYHAHTGGYRILHFS